MNTRIVIDTNVFISSIINEHGFAFKIINEIVLNGFVVICLSDEILAEVHRVSRYRRLLKKHPRLTAKADFLMETLFLSAIHVQSGNRLSVIKDESDNRFLEAAVAAKADFLITGNTRDFTFEEYEAIKIMTPKAFYELFSTEK